MSHTPSDANAEENAAEKNPAEKSPTKENAIAENAIDEGSDDEYRQTVSQLLRVPAPPSFRSGIEETIRRRSGGRFFGRKAFGDRVPYELVIAVLILAIGLVAYLVLRSSSTGSLRYEKEQDTEIVAPDAEDVVPQPPSVE